MYCDKIKEISRDIKEWVYYQPSVNEESVTDRLLYSLSREVPGVYYRSFTRHEEARKTGADWERWILFNGGSYKLRVQAKKEKKDNYPSIAYTNKHGLQIEKLLNDSLAVNALPFYAFYSASNNKTMCAHGITDEGVYLTSAQGLYDNYIVGTRKKVDISDIMIKSNPLSCFFCCPLLKHNTVSGFEDYLDRYFGDIDYSSIVESDAYNDNNMVNFDRIGYHEKSPRYVEEIISNEIYHETYESEYSRYIQGVDGILVIDNRNKEEDFED